MLFKPGRAKNLFLKLCWNPAEVLLSARDLSIWLAASLGALGCTILHSRDQPDWFRSGQTQDCGRKGTDEEICHTASGQRGNNVRTDGLSN